MPVESSHSNSHDGDRRDIWGWSPGCPGHVCSRIIVLELLKAAPHSGTMPGLLIRGPGFRRLSVAALLMAPGGRPIELDTSATALAGPVAVAGARYCHGSRGKR